MQIEISSNSISTYHSDYKANIFKLDKTNAASTAFVARFAIDLTFSSAAIALSGKWEV